jgi:hypothetical protein
MNSLIEFVQSLAALLGAMLKLVLYGFLLYVMIGLVAFCVSVSNKRNSAAATPTPIPISGLVDFKDDEPGLPHKLPDLPNTDEDPADLWH